ncbi:MAG TPA: hypothetical protein VK574_15205 [Terracidiphilus sp.]|jgi:hypothetical protein|nr:hypothetical protein [Terracidiphilus sp.]
MAELALPANPRSSLLFLKLFFLRDIPPVCIQPFSIPADEAVGLHFQVLRNSSGENNVNLINRQGIRSSSGVGLS